MALSPSTKTSAEGDSPDPAAPADAKEESRTLLTSAQFVGVRIESKSGVAVEVARSGALFSIRHGRTLINQVFSGPAEDGLFRLLLRWRGTDGKGGWASIAGAGREYSRTGPLGVAWRSEPAPGLRCTAMLDLHPEAAAWTWRVQVTNGTGGTLSFDALMAQDLGLGDEGAVRNSEFFTSQYIDLLPLADPALGWIVCARQNLEMSGGQHPWLAAACDGGTRAFATDGWQFFGADHRHTGTPRAALEESLPSRALQYECAMIALQSLPKAAASDASAEFAFTCRFSADHRDASSPADASALREVLGRPWAPRDPLAHAAGWTKPGSSLFTRAEQVHGCVPTDSDWARWYPGERRHAERDSNGALLSFFTGTDTHVVSIAKESALARPHGHIIRSGDWSWIDMDQMGLTAYAAGVFASQAYLGNQSLARFLPVSRDALGLLRSTGQRVFMRLGLGDWVQLGIPSVFAMTPGSVRWLYKIASGIVEVRAWCSAERPATFMSIETSGDLGSAEFLVTHTLALNGNEFDHAGEVHICPGLKVARCVPASTTLLAQREPGARFAVAAAEVSPGAQVTGDEALFPDGERRGVPCVCVRLSSNGRAGVILCGTRGGDAALDGTIAAARAEWRSGRPGSSPPRSPFSLSLSNHTASAQAAVGRVNEILPWLVHNAAVHFSAPHGLEQHSGAAWGVRDVCQGSVEWLLTGGELALTRRALETVFAQQYAHDGSWPQWFMHPPFSSIRQEDSHGDVMFWPVKALCDYLEASNDLGFLDCRVPYVDVHTFLTTATSESLIEHCDRVVNLCEARFVPGTALVNYGDGDWDDTLRPAVPEMRTRMISSWTVGLAYHTFRQLAAIYGRTGDSARHGRLVSLLARMRSDFEHKLMPDAIVAGFMVSEPEGMRPLLHPRDSVTGIRYRLLPMTRAVLAELFSPEEAARHLDIVAKELLYPDGVRLMSEPARYQGGCERLFKRADSAANVGREIGLQYVHAHLRYAEAMAKVGDAERLWTALQVVNPVGLSECVANAAPRQSNVYFSSSDADFDTRAEASLRWGELKAGSVRVRGGWRLYSSGPGLFIHKVRSCLLGLRDSFGDIVFDPVLPKGLDGLTAHIHLCGRPVRLSFNVKHGTHAPESVVVNGTALDGAVREENPYRKGGLRFASSRIDPLLLSSDNSIIVNM